MSSSEELQSLIDAGLDALGRADKDAAEQAFSQCVTIDDSNAETWCYLGIALAPYDHERATQALERALELSPGHTGALYWLAETNWVHGDPEDAVPFLERMVENAPDSPQMIARLGLARMAAAQGEVARKTLDVAADAGGGTARATLDPTELRRAIYLNLAGRESEAEALIEQVNGPGPAKVLPDSLYPNDLEQQRCALEDVVAGRDIVIMGSGPSLERLPDALSGLDVSALDRLCFFGFNNVPVAEAMLRESVGRDVDLACMTSGTVMQIHAAWLEEFLSRPKGSNLLFALMSAVTAHESTARLMEGARHRTLYFNSSSDHPPTSSDPLHFPPINTLLCVLPLAVLAQPRRIFLFGCDGAVATPADGGSEGVYFRQGSDAYGDQAPPNRGAYANWLVRDTFFFNALIPTVLQALCTLFKLPMPEIHLCNPDSSYRPFPRISPDDFAAMVSEAAGGSGIYRAQLDQANRRVRQLEARVQAMDSEHSLRLDTVQTQLRAEFQAALQAEIRAITFVTLARRTAGKIKRRLTG